MRRPAPGAHPDSRTGRSTGSEMVFNDMIETTGMIIDAAGVVVIVTGAAAASVITAVRFSRRDSAVYQRFRQQLGQAILLGLELLVAGDIVRTVAASPSLTGVAILAAIVLIRTFLSFSLQVETTGRWPWQKRDNSPSLDQERPSSRGRPMPDPGRMQHRASLRSASATGPVAGRIAPQRTDTVAAGPCTRGRAQIGPFRAPCL